MRFSFAVGVLVGLVPSLAEKNVLLVDLIQEYSNQDGRNTRAASTLSSQLQGSLKGRGAQRKLPGNEEPSSFAGRRRLRRGPLQNGQKGSASKECDPSSSDPDVGVLSCGTGHYCKKSQQSTLGGTCVRGNRLRNRHRLTLNSQECNPNLIDVDIGILACPAGTHCVESTVSSMGGFCAPLAGSLRREDDTYYYFYAVCDPSTKYYQYYPCDCDDFNLKKETGIIHCYPLDNHCFADYDPGCSDTCVSSTIYYMYDGSSYVYEKCYSYSSPYQQETCYSYKYGVPESPDPSCSYSIDGVECNSCSYSPDCTALDCTNTLLESSFCYGEQVAPILQHCVGVNCTICQAGDGHLPNPYGKVTLPDGEEYQCWELDMMGQQRNFSETECAAVTSLANSTCCSPVDSCSICEGGGVVYPDAIVGNATSGGVLCSDIESAALAGYLGGDESETCKYVSLVAQEPCCGVIGNYTSCSLCPTGTQINDYGIVSLPDSGNYTCMLLDLFGELGHLNHEECIGVRYFAEDTCCGCNVCGVSGEVVTNLEEKISIPDMGNVTCFELQEIAGFGALNDTECSYVQPLVRDACDCKPGLRR